MVNLGWKRELFDLNTEFEKKRVGVGGQETAAL